eukprot:1366106-Amorphochlora_amoeboformis.AAC.1
MATIEDDPFAALNTKLLHEINKPRALVEFQLVKHLLKSRANANTKNDEGESLLILASKHGNYQVVKLLLTEIERESSFKFCMPVFERIMRVIRIITDHDEELRLAQLDVKHPESVCDIHIYTIKYTPIFVDISINPGNLTEGCKTTSNRNHPVISMPFLRGDTTEDGIPAANWMKMFYCTARRQIDIG